METTSNRDLDAAHGELAGDRGAHRIGSADRHGRFVDDDSGPSQRAPDRARDFEHVREIGAAVLVRRRADGDEDDLRLAPSPTSAFGGERQPSAAAIRAHQRFEARLVDRNLAALEARDLVRVDIDADDVVADFGKAGSGDQTNIASAEDRHAHDGIAFIAGGCPSCRARDDAG